MYITIDQCRELGCRCLDTAGVVIYRGESLAEAEEAKQQARYPEPQIEVVAGSDEAATY